MDDVQLGLWCARIPQLDYVNLQGAWHELPFRGFRQLDGATLLSAHRLPWACWRDAIAATQSFRAELLQSSCKGRSLCADCTHDAVRQRSCHVQLHSAVQAAFTCAAVFNHKVEDDTSCAS